MDENEETSVQEAKFLNRKEKIISKGLLDPCVNAGASVCPAVQVQLFGSFRNLSDHQKVSFTISSGLTVKKFKDLLIEHFLKLPRSHSLNVRDLVEYSVIANEEEILKEDDLIQVGQTLALLPPVCGG